MKKTIFWAVIQFTFVCLLTAFFSGCAKITPPDVTVRQQQFYDNYSDIKIVVHFLTTTEYETVYISNTSGSMLADLKDVPIPDDETAAAINRLLTQKSYLNIFKDGNTITLTQWRGSMDIISGIAYSIDGEDLPVVQYVTELTPLSAQGWYFFIADYNQWRIENAKT